MFLLSMMAIFLVCVLLGLSHLLKNSHKYPKLASLLEKIKKRLFFNPLIRYSLLNYLKFMLIASLCIEKGVNDTVQLVIGVILFIALNLMAVLYARFLRRRSL